MLEDALTDLSLSSFRFRKVSGVITSTDPVLLSCSLSSATRHHNNCQEQYAPWECIGLEMEQVFTSHLVWYICKRKIRGLLGEGGVMAQWYSVGHAIKIAGSIPSRCCCVNDCGQVFHTHVPLLPSSIIWYQCKSWEGNSRLWKRCGLPSITPGACPLPAQD